MNAEKIEILKQIFPDFFIRKGEEFVCFCPKHHHHKKKLEISLAKNNFACWVCKWSGSIFKLLREYGTKEHTDRYFSLLGYKPTNDEKEEEILLPQEYAFLPHALEKNSHVAKLARAYLDKSGIGDDVISYNKIGVCASGEFENRIIFPSFDAEGKLNCFTSRVIPGYDGPKHRLQGRLGRIVFNEVYVDWSKPVLLVESVKTHCRHLLATDNIIALNGSRISKNYELFKKIIINNCPLVYVGFDPDADEESFDTISKFEQYNIPIKFVKFSKQPDELETEDFLEAIENANTINKFDTLKHKIERMIA